MSARGVGRFLVDWRNATTLLAALLVALLLFVVVSSVVTVRESQHVADTALGSARAAATRRIDRLQDTINAQQQEIRANRETLGEQAAALDALSRQVRQLGAQPVIAGPGREPVAREPEVAPAPSPTPRTGPAQPARSPTPAPSPRASASPSSRPSPRPSPSSRPVYCRVPLPLPGC